jgi:S-adenosylmethionine:tRNA ribosyltransferase-isomerase
MFALDDYAYALPDALIAQHPAAERDRSRLMVLDRAGGGLAHRHFHELPEILDPGDLLVLNDTRVVPARLTGRKVSGGRVEVLLLDFAGARERAAETGRFESLCLVRASRRPRPGERLHFAASLTAEVLGEEGHGLRLRFSAEGDAAEALLRQGQMPLPPYIRRDDPRSSPCDDERAYQTVYAARAGAVAAPTAGLHFSRDLLERLARRGVRTATITLHVGYGTFLPVRVQDIREHRMHAEHFRIPSEAAAAVNAARREGRRVIAVGTTCVRSLEFAAAPDGRLTAAEGANDLFIYPGYRFRVVDAMITNFHLPRSTLLMLAAAFAGRETILAAYGDAVARGYRFFSYGDAMLIA